VRKSGLENKFAHLKSEGDKKSKAAVHILLLLLFFLADVYVQISSSGQYESEVHQKVQKEQASQTEVDGIKR
jgi:hypothetical protein